MDGPAIDAPFYKPNQSVYVMENAFTFKKCKKKLSTYEYGICRGCPEKNNCPIPRKHNEQKNHPIVVMTHSRLKMESNSLEKYSTWRNVDGAKYNRRLIIIDEKPPLIDIKSIKLHNFDQLIFDLKSMECELEVGELERCNELMSQLRDKTLALQEEGGRLDPVNPNFSFGFTGQWYKKYYGDDVELLKRIEHLIRNGGLVHLNHKREISITTKNVIEYNFNKFNVAILDGTATYDMDYKTLHGGTILDVPKIKSYENLTFHIDSSQSASKSKLLNNAALLEDIARNVKVFSESEQVLVLCYKDSEKQLKFLLEDEIKKGKVLINHYGNVKGSNNYSDCTVLVLIGVTHKGDPFYINKYEVIYKCEATTKTITTNHVRRFQDVLLETVKMNDQLVDTIQDILRIKIRNKCNESPIKVYIPTKDQVLIKLLGEYFRGSTFENWRINETYPNWYKPLMQILQRLNIGDKLRKSKIKEYLGLSGAAGKKYFQRIQKDPLFINLFTSHGVTKLNTQTYIRLNSSSAVSDK